ncbi:hypothetical protein CQW23_32142 [Capsicum baccatum]|uniref:Uncharacterized protein n=1 Tax=Capsicum baccatum TaxID=33114 RepID=A0A2G2V5I9_CAPBA|nr:hypothetical protein CQW23_32142 [Capsicum baccatum]
MAAFTLTHPLSPPNFLSPHTNSPIGTAYTRQLSRFRNLSRSISCSVQPEKEPFKPITEEKILEAVADFKGAEKSIPCLRTYENDLARLTLIGGVDFEQALTAAAADGGEAAGEHIAAGVNAIVVETLFPGYMNVRSTVSIRLVDQEASMYRLENDVVVMPLIL